MIDQNITQATNSRHILFIVVHCSATQPSVQISSIQRYWRESLGWMNPGYHYIIEANGNIVNLLSETLNSNGVEGHNSRCIHICYIGGIDKKGIPTDTRTPEQKAALASSLKILKAKYPHAVIQGHRDFPGVRKACPSFNAKAEYAGLK